MNNGQFNLKNKLLDYIDCYLISMQLFKFVFYYTNQ